MKSWTISTFYSPYAPPISSSQQNYLVIRHYSIISLVSIPLHHLGSNNFWPFFASFLSAVFYSNYYLKVAANFPKFELEGAKVNFKPLVLGNYLTYYLNSDYCNFSAGFDGAMFMYLLGLIELKRLGRYLAGFCGTYGLWPVQNWKRYVSYSEHG